MVSTMPAPPPGTAAWYHQRFVYFRIHNGACITGLTIVLWEYILTWPQELADWRLLLGKGQWRSYRTPLMIARYCNLIYAWNWLMLLHVAHPPNCNGPLLLLRIARLLQTSSLMLVFLLRLFYCLPKAGKRYIVAAFMAVWCAHAAMWIRTIPPGLWQLAPDSAQLLGADVERLCIGSNNPAAAPAYIFFASFVAVITITMLSLLWFTVSKPFPRYVLRQSTRFFCWAMFTDAGAIAMHFALPTTPWIKDVGLPLSHMINTVIATRLMHLADRTRMLSEVSLGRQRHAAPIVVTPFAAARYGGGPPPSPTPMYPSATYQPTTARRLPRTVSCASFSERTCAMRRLPPQGPLPPPPGYKSASSFESMQQMTTEPNPSDYSHESDRAEARTSGRDSSLIMRSPSTAHSCTGTARMLQILVESERTIAMDAESSGDFDFGAGLPQSEAGTFDGIEEVTGTHEHDDAGAGGVHAHRAARLRTLSGSLSRMAAAEAGRPESSGGGCDPKRESQATRECDEEQQQRPHRQAQRESQYEALCGSHSPEHEKEYWHDPQEHPRDSENALDLTLDAGEQEVLSQEAVSRPASAQFTMMATRSRQLDHRRRESAVDSAVDAMRADTPEAQPEGSTGQQARDPTSE